MIALLLARWPVLVGLPILVAVMLLAHALLWPTYEAQVIMQPTRPASGVSDLGGIAATLGLGTVSNTDGVDYYAGLMRARATVASLALATIDSAGETRFIDSLDIDGDSERDSVAKAVDKLRELIDISIDVKAGFLTVTARSHSPQLAEALARTAVLIAESTAIAQRHRTGLAERRFLEGRVARLQEELLSAEDSARSFFEENRTWQMSPRLRFEGDRLMATAARIRSVYTDIARAYEMARVEEARNTPSLFVISGSEGSADREFGLAVIMGVTVLTALGTAAVVAFAQYLRIRAGDEREDYDAAMQVLRRLAQPFRRGSP